MLLLFFFLLLLSCMFATCNGTIDTALVRPRTELELVQNVTTEFDFITQGQIVAILNDRRVNNNNNNNSSCTISIYKQRKCNLIHDGIQLDAHLNKYPQSRLGDATLVVSTNQVAICGVVAVRTLCPTSGATTMFEGTNLVYNVKQGTQVATFSTVPTSTNENYCVGVCVNTNKQELCLKFKRTTEFENCTYHGWHYIAPSPNQSMDASVECVPDFDCSGAVPLASIMWIASVLFLSVLFLL